MNHLTDILSHWMRRTDEADWVLATIVSTDGSTYRKAGAMMLINSLGQYRGLLSGGCLESDIMLQARRCWETGKNRIIQYDMREEEDIAWQLGLGCGGMVRILLQPILAENDYLHLPRLYQLLSSNQSCGYCQTMNEEQPVNAILTEKELQARLSPAQRCQQIESGQQSPQLLHRLLPPWHLAVFGGGVDARPVVALAAELGWQITLCDPRIVNNRAANFHPSVRIIRQAIEQQKQESWIGTVDAVLILTHNIDLDAQALQLVQHSSARYTGLLGPEHRTKRVLAHADLTQEQLTTSLASPVGLRLGGELPESIALAMVAEVHAFLHQADGQSMSHILSNNS